MMPPGERGTTSREQPGRGPGPRRRPVVIATAGVSLAESEAYRSRRGRARAKGQEARGNASHRSPARGDSTRAPRGSCEQGSHSHRGVIGESETSGSGEPRCLGIGVEHQTARAG